MVERPAPLLNRVTLYETIRLCEAALLYFPAVQQTAATRVSGGKPTRSAGPPGPSTGSGAAASLCARNLLSLSNKIRDATRRTAIAAGRLRCRYCVATTLPQHALRGPVGPLKPSPSLLASGGATFAA
ncbi:hypothetical protein GCM10023096_18690 [Nonomuraea ferruginea]